MCRYIDPEIKVARFNAEHIAVSSAEQTGETFSTWTKEHSSTSKRVTLAEDTVPITAYMFD